MYPYINYGWEDRYEALKTRVNFEVPLERMLDGFLEQLSVHGDLTIQECDRTRWKIQLITPFYTRMVLNMIKGTIKYPSDDWSADTWQDMGMDDKADSINYELLFHEHLRRQGKI